MVTSNFFRGSRVERSTSSRARRGTVLSVVLLVVANLTGGIALFASSASASPTGVSSTIYQCTNGKVSDPQPCQGSSGAKVNGFQNWTGGNANASNAHWSEGQFIPYRAVISGLPAGSYEEQFQFDTTWKSLHAIDYLGSYDATETTGGPAGNNANQNNPCTDVLPSGECAAPPTAPTPVSLYPIPGATFFTASSAAACSLSATDPLSPKGGQQAGNVALFGPTGSTIDNVYYVTQNVAQSSGCYTTFAVDFTVPQSVTGTATVVVAWGGHIASSTDWGANVGAADINGSPYHMLQAGTFLTLSGPGGTENGSITVGAEDLPMAASAIVVDSTATSTVVYNASNATPASNSNQITQGGSVYDSATVTNTTSTSTPSGQVEFDLYSGTCPTSGSPTTTPLSTYDGTLNASGVATSSTTSNLQAGNYFYIATYLGTPAYLGSTATCEPFTVAGVSITKTAAQTTVSLPATTSPTSDYFTITPTVTGYVAAGQQVTVTDPLPADPGVTYGTVTPSSSALSCPASAAGLTTLTCTYTAPSGGAMSPILGSIQVNFTVDNTATPDTLSNTATVAFGTLTAKATATVAVTQAAPVLGITKTADVPTVSFSSGSTSDVKDYFTITPTVTGWIPGNQTITVTDTMPVYTGVTYGTVTASNSAVSCPPTASSGATLTCTYTAPAGGVYSPSLGTIQVDFSVAVLAPAGNFINTATVATGGVSQSAQATVTVKQPNSVLSLTKSPDVATINLPATTSPTSDYFTITPTVTGYVAAGQEITLTDTLPTYPGVTWTSFTPSAGSPLSCTGTVGSGDTITCTYTSPSGTDSLSLGTIQVDFTVDNSTAPGNLDNTATLSYNGHQLAATGEVVIDQAAPVLGISKIANVTSIALPAATSPTSDYFTITPTVAGWVPAGTLITVSDPLPAWTGVTYGAVTYSGTTLSCPTSASSGSVTCTYTAPAGGVYSPSLGTIQVDFTVDNSTAPTTLVNTASVALGNQTITATATVGITQAPAVPGITKTANVTSIALPAATSPTSDYFTITPTVTGWVPGGATVTMTDSVPVDTGVTYTSAAYSYTTGEQFMQCTSPFTGGVLTCTFTAPSGGIYDPSFGSIQVNFTVDNSAEPATLSNTAYFEAGGTTANATATVGITQAAPKLSIDKTAASPTVGLPSSVAPAPDSFTITPTVTGWVPGDTLITVSDPLPAWTGVTYGTVTYSGSTLSCPTSASSGSITCTYTAPADGVYSPSLGTIQVDFTIDNSTAPTTLVNTAYVTVGLQSANHTADVVITQAAPVLGITKTVNVATASFSSGNTTAVSDYFTIAPTVTGWLPGGQVVTVTDPLPVYAGVTYGTVTPSSTDVSCTTATASGVTTVTCTYTAPSSGVYSPSLGTIRVDFTIDSSAPAGTFTNVAKVASGGTSTTAQATVTVDQQASTITIAKSPDQGTISLPAATSPTSDFFTITPTVTGYAPAGQTISVTDTLPTYAGVTWTSVTPSAGSPLSCTGTVGSGNTITCTYTPTAGVVDPTLGTIQVNFTVDNSTAPGTLTNTADMTFNGSSGNASADVSINQANPSVTLVKSAAQSMIAPATDVGTTSDSYTLTPKVLGWVAGQEEISVVDSLPTYGGYVTYTGVSVSSGSPFSNCAITSNQLTCSYTPTKGVYDPSLGTITIAFTVGNDAPAGTFANTAYVTVGNGGSPTPSNQVTVTVTPPPPVLGITKSASSPAAQPGGTDGFVLLPTVSGWVYHTVTISDPLPQPYMTSTGSPVLSGSSLPTGSTFTCSVVSETVTCTFTPPSGGVFSPNLGSVTVPVAFSGSTPAGVYTNTATVSDTGDGSTSMQSSATVTVSTPPAAPSVAPPPTPTPTSVAVPSTVPTGGHFGTRWFYFLIAVNGIAVLEISRRLLRRKRTA